MELFRRFAVSLSRFMAGRYGMDYFNYCLWWIYLILFIIEVIVSLFSRVAGAILSILLWALLIYMIFRMLSRNHSARSRENLWWSRIWSKTPFGKNGKARFGGFGNPYGGPGGYSGYGGSGGAGGYGGYGQTGTGAASGGNFYGADSAPKKKKKAKLPRDKDHVYRICPSCKANIRLPKKKGRHSVRCPRCSTLFDVKI